MKKSEEIYKDARKLEEIPNSYNLLEINCFMALKEVISLFYRKAITKEQAAKHKQQIFGIYEKEKAIYLKDKEIYGNTINDIKKTEDLRIMLRHQLKEQNEHSLDTALRLIEMYSGEKWELDEILNKEMAEDMFKILKAINKSNVQKGEKKEIECPICGEKAIVGKCSSNGHIHFGCSSCKTSLMQ